MSQKKFSVPVHPGVFLKEEFLDPLGISPHVFAKKIDVLPNTMEQLLKGKKQITGELALRLSDAVATDPEMWLQLQNSYDNVYGQEELPASDKSTRANGKYPDTKSSGVENKPFDLETQSSDPSDNTSGT